MANPFERRYRADTDGDFRLADHPTRDDSCFEGDAGAGRERLAALRGELADLQARLYAESRRSVLVVLQAMDAAGKDSTVRDVLRSTNPMGVHAHGFGRPSAEELAPRSRWERRYRHIREFERMLADEDVTILKFFLHLSRDEQREQFQQRLDDPRKRWKFDRADLDTRARWDDYMEAYEDAIRETSTEWAPWYVVPADRRWYRKLAIVEILVDALHRLDPQYPPEIEGLDDIVVDP